MSAGPKPTVVPGPFAGLHDRVGFWGLLVILCAFTLSTGDGGDLAPLVLSGALLLTAAFFLSFPPDQSFVLRLPSVCLLAMTLYGVLQTLFFPQKIAFLGWKGVLFWFCALVIALVSAGIFASARAAAAFRSYFVFFGTAISVLDLLQQASQTNQYFWLIPSRYPTVFGPFAYWNNFAQFVELVLPVTLWKALGGKAFNLLFTLCAAVQIGAVVASGSRAGSVLVIAELLAVILVAFTRNRNRLFLAGAVLTVAISVAFVYAAGFETIITKLRQNDLLAVRRSIDRSSLAMIRQRPWTGWGLGTYVPVYRMFALYDDGTLVNQAHNDWLEWVAGGGIPFACAMLVVLFWTIRPAVRSGWGLGLIALSIHALVDYPFARLGVCGWYFCLLGMLQAARSRWRSQALESGR